MKKEKAKKYPISEEMENRLKAHLKTKERLFGEDSPFSELLQGMVNQMLEGEMEVFQAEQKAANQKNKRNGYTSKRVRSESGYLDIHTPRDRNSNFEPEIIGKGARELSSGLDEQILALYAQGNSIEDVRRLLKSMYGVEISSGKISQITDKILPVLQEWRRRPLGSMYAIVYLDAVYFKVRHEGRYDTRAFYTVYAVDWQGQRDLLGMYVQGEEGSSRWALVLADLKSRGVEDMLVCCTDDLNGLREVIEDIFPKTVVQKCIVHQVRNSLKYVSDKERRKVASDLRKIYTSKTREEARTALKAFEAKWGHKYEYVVSQWEEKWEELMAFLDYPEDMRRMIYTTNPVEALHRIIRKLIKGKAAWVSEHALIKQLYLSLMHNEKSWRRKARGWKDIQRSLLKKYPDRVPKLD